MGDEMNNLTPRCKELAARVAEIMGPWEPDVGDNFMVKMEGTDTPYLGHVDDYTATDITDNYGAIWKTRIPVWLPTLTDCLDFLRGRLGWFCLQCDEEEGFWEVSWFPGKNPSERLRIKRGDTPLEAAYEAVIATEEGEK